MLVLSYLHICVCVCVGFSLLVAGAREGSDAISGGKGASVADEAKAGGAVLFSFKTVFAVCGVNTKYEKFTDAEQHDYELSKFFKIKKKDRRDVTGMGLVLMMSSI